MQLRAHAKINLDLRVLNRRPDGYHDISTVFQTLALHDVVTLESSPGPLEVSTDDPDVPTGDGNLCARGVRALWSVCGRVGEPSGIRVHLQKRIPMAAGLGGGSSDAASTLAGLARLWSLSEQDPRLHEAARQVGADVPFFLLGGTALGLGRGDELFPLADARPAEVVLVQPPFGIATADAYRWHDELRRGESGGLVEASIRQGRVLSGCQNHLERGVSIRRPEVGELTARMRVLNARLAAMTGSGSVVFGVFDTAEQADRAADAMRDGSHRVIRTSLLGRSAFERSRWLGD